MYYYDSLYQEKTKAICVHHCFEWRTRYLLVARCDVTSRLVSVEKLAFVQVIKQSANISGNGKVKRVRAQERERDRETQSSDVDRLAQIQWTIIFLAFFYISFRWIPLLCNCKSYNAKSKRFAFTYTILCVCVVNWQQTECWLVAVAGSPIVVLFWEY